MTRGVSSSPILGCGLEVSGAPCVQQELATIVRNTCRAPHTGDNAPTFKVTTTPNPKQRRALELLDAIRL